MPIPSVLRSMSTKSIALLAEDLGRWGSEIEGLSYRSVCEFTGLGVGRAERLHAWFSRHGVTPPGEENQAENRAPLEALEGTEPLAKPGLRIEHGPEGMTVAAQGNDSPSSPLGQGIVRNVEELFAQADLDPAKWVAENVKIRTWSTPMRRQGAQVDGVRQPDEIVVVRNWYCSASIRPRLDAQTGPADWGTPIVRTTPPASAGERPSIAVVIPDIHVGYRWSRGHQSLVPLHDWNAIAAGLALIEAVMPDEVVILGDGADFAPFSTKFPTPLELRDTTRPTILTLHAILREIRRIVPWAKITYKGGNHEARAKNALTGTEYDGLTPADDIDGPELVSFARMLGLEALDIDYDDYGERSWLFGRIEILHGQKVKPKGGQTVAAVLQDVHHSVIFGHIHRCETAMKTIDGPDGRRVITAASPGTWGRLDGVLPGAGPRADWQQGVGIVRYDHERRQEHIAIHPIFDGVLHCEGRSFVGDGAALADRIAKQIKYAQIVAA